MYFSKGISDTKSVFVPKHLDDDCPLLIRIFQSQAASACNVLLINCGQIIARVFIKFSSSISEKSVDSPVEEDEVCCHGDKEGKFSS